MKKLLALVAILSIWQHLLAQDLAPTNGIQESKPAFYLFKNATILVAPTKTIQNGQLLIKGKEIVEIGSSINAPKEAVVVDCKGKTIVPAFIETYTQVGLPALPTNSQGAFDGATHWNKAIHPEIDASTYFRIQENANKELLKMGFGLAVTHFQNGIARGNGALISLGNTNENEQLIRTEVASYFSFKPGLNQDLYPTSQMGSIALLRQTFYDLNWYKHNQNKTALNNSLTALERQIHHPMIFFTEDKWELFRVTKIGTEFNLPFILFGSGAEYGVIPQLKQQKNKLIIPINFPAPYEVKDPYAAREIPLSDLKHWDLAPSNPAILRKNNISFAISSFGNKNDEEFWKNLRKAIANGLNPADAMYALTVEPAKLLGIDQEFGTLEKGKKASFMIYDGNPFTTSASLLDAWILGEQHVLKHEQLIDIRGQYNAFLDGYKYPLAIAGTIASPITTVQVQTTKKDEKTGVVKTDTLSIQANTTLLDNNLTIQFTVDDVHFKGSVHLHAKVNSKLGIFEGDGMLPNGKWVQWSAIRNNLNKEVKDERSIKVDTTNAPKIWYPNLAFGLDSLPKQQTIAFIHATVWTNEAAGILQDATVLVEQGKITYVGPGNQPIPAQAKIIDATGKVLTSGIIDEHSHICIAKGVNESGQAVTAEVRVEDVVTPEDINLYRQLAGGVTVAQLLHGSANPIGGQSALIKLKWGHAAEELLIPNAPKFIKFALGENVKQTNWGNAERFPQTRMGVEQVFYDAFSRADLYSNEWRHFKKAAEGNHNHHLRRDLELEAIAEIVNGERFITCHSYSQSEIKMLMHIADSMHFKINTFTHILEGYKLADELAKRQIVGSTFSDWWAYKYEVNDGIPYNAKLMMDQGVLVCINSDDAEMGRRLNQEAAKAIKYGGMSEQDAWKMITLNPAKALHLDHKMGSVAVGKDADLVLWNQNPLTINAVVEYTIVDGEILYSKAQEQALNIRNQQERARILSKMMELTEKGEEAKPFSKRKRRQFHCNTIGEEALEETNMH